MVKSGRRKGRPRRQQPKPGERVSLGLRVTPELKEALDNAAKSSGRSQSQEAELRLEHSFLKQKFMVEALELTYGRELAGLLLTIGEAMKWGARLVGFEVTHTSQGSESWFNNKHAYFQAAMAAAMVIQEARPEGCKPPLKDFENRTFDLGDEWFFITNSLLEESATGSKTGNTAEADERAASRSRMLGPIIVERILKRVHRRGNPVCAPFTQPSEEIES